MKPVKIEFYDEHGKRWVFTGNTRADAIRKAGKHMPEQLREGAA